MIYKSFKKLFRKGVSPVLVVVLFVLFSSCQQKRGMVFGLLMPSFNDDYFVQARQHFEKSIKAKGGEVITYDGQNNEALQMQQASDLIAAGVSVIVIDAINANSAAAIVREAHEKGVKVLAYDRLIMNCDLDFYVTYNSVKIGELMASYALNKYPKGNYILFYGDATDMNAGFLREGFMNILQKPINSGDVSIMYQTYIENWSGENAYHQMKRILDFSMDYPDVVLSSYDGMSTKTIEALDEVNIGGKVIVTGQNGEIEAFQNIVRGKQSMTLYKPVEQLAQKSAEIAWNLALNKKDIEGEVLVDNNRIKVRSLLLEPILVDINNLHQEIIEKKVFTEEQLYELAEN